MIVVTYTKSIFLIILKMASVFFKSILNYFYTSYLTMSNILAYSYKLAQKSYLTKEKEKLEPHFLYRIKSSHAHLFT